ncbi:MAG: hypothetical protein JXP73_11720 [Deltaproteobacteria bacterium]|nr:hypothetical protein [Deltaproteobacteria bacterium]
MAQRLSLRAGDSLQVPLAGVESVMTIDERTAQVVVSSGGFTVLGRAIGDTIVQIFTASKMHVYVVSVQAPPPRPPGPPPVPNINDHGAITSFWGDNRYQIHYSESSLLRSRFDHLLTFHGRVGKGEYQANAQFMTGALGNHLQYTTLGWLSDKKDLSFELGDTHGRMFGSSLSGAAPVRGLRSSLTRKFGGDRGEWTGEIFVGEVRSGADPYATSLRQPAAGASMSGAYAPFGLPSLRLSFASSLFAFSTASTSALQPGHVGVFAGATGRAAHSSGLTLDFRLALSVSAPHIEGGRATTVPGFGVSAQYKASDGGLRLEYDNNQAGMVVPQNGGAMPGSQRIAGSFDRHVGAVSVSGGASYAMVEDLFGQSAGGLSYQIGTSVPVAREAKLSLSGGQSNVTLPVSTAAGRHYLREWSKSHAATRLDYAPQNNPWSLLSELSFSKSRTSDGSSLGASGTLSLQKRRAPAGKWDGAGVLTVMAMQPHIDNSVLAVDQPPLDVTTSASGQVRFVQGPFESFGGLGLQVRASPSYRAAPTINLGFRFTPTAAHQIAASFGSTRWLQSGAWNHSVSATYVYHFGDAVRATPIFEFMSYGVVEGRVCYDEDSDGNCSPDEPPIPGIPLVLSNGARATSAADGGYRFERVKPGFYHLDVDEEAMRERGRPTTMLVAAFDLPVRGNERKSFGVARACRIRGHLVHDLDMDGSIDDGEPLFGGPLVVASGAAGTFQSPVNSSGTFALTVPCGEYGLEIDPASLPSMHQAGDDEEILVTTTANDTPVAKLMVRSLRTIAGDVFIDKNGNGQKDADEAVVPNAVVRFGEASGPTDETGAFLLRRLPAGKGQVVVDADSLPPGLRPGEPSAQSLPNQAAAIENVHLPVVPEP